MTNRAILKIVKIVPVPIFAVPIFARIISSRFFIKASFVVQL
jgi:hypothetical protein